MRCKFMLDGLEALLWRSFLTGNIVGSRENTRTMMLDSHDSLSNWSAVQAGHQGQAGSSKENSMCISEQIPATISRRACRSVVYA